MKISTPFPEDPIDDPENDDPLSEKADVVTDDNCDRSRTIAPPFSVDEQSVKTAEIVAVPPVRRTTSSAPPFAATQFSNVDEVRLSWPVIESLAPFPVSEVVEDALKDADATTREAVDVIETSTERVRLVVPPMNEGEMDRAAMDEVVTEIRVLVVVGTLKTLLKSFSFDGSSSGASSSEITKKYGEVSEGEKDVCEWTNEAIEPF
ncbi:hypothetical protein BLNAU_20402 [Blattamonas nauphoetae]|uniref:Uncharacterized protein n=1 Tax=Blattamonas nauphoetae TaxID=2049346 RepID=A0ABQ9WYS2_9EUKA|nr:hypothetical protein BLNAU_20402 [Blattamonas nauphoetae]